MPTALAHPNLVLPYVAHLKEVEYYTSSVGSVLSDCRVPASLNVKVYDLGSSLPIVAYHGQLIYMKADNASPDISLKPGRQIRRHSITRHDPLSVRFNRRVIEDVIVDEELINAIARFNYYLYHFGSSTDTVGNYGFRVRLHRLVPSADHELREDLHEVLVPAAEEEDLFAHLHPQLIQNESMPLPPGPIPVRELVIRGTMLDSYYGLSLSNDSHCHLFFYVIYLDPVDFGIQASLNA